MDKRLQEVMQGNEGSYVFPFFWQRGNHTEQIPTQIERIAKSGARELCVESKSHPDFCGDGWWRDMDIILDEAEKRGMRVWILDDDRFPTGHAAGMIAKKYPHLRQWNLTERHIDVAGPMQGASFLAKESRDTEAVLLGAFAYRRLPDAKETCRYEAIDLTAEVEGEFLYWDVPEGVWRIFFYYRSRLGGFDNYIDMISSESVAVLIESVYETHYARYADRFGKTIAGFFSDEPAYANLRFAKAQVDYGFYESRIGTPGIALPWNENVRRMMEEKLGFDPTAHLNLLWYDDDANGNDQADLRFAYMDAITRLYSECFTKQLGDWCRAHGVLYTGHVIEDMGSHCHMFRSAGHYFRSTMWQDLSGVDVVLQQIMPGMEHYFHTASAEGLADGEFFHYVLAKLGASMAHLNPLMKGRAMCEVFGAYGWGLDTPMMKYLADGMLVRGINHFVPHAFSTKFPDPEYPPHFSAEGHNPSYEGFSRLISYLNRASHLLYDAKHIANAAVLYNAEGEWASRTREAMTMQPIVTRLYDAHIDYDIIPMDMLANARVEGGKLTLAAETFDCLILPHADHLPRELQEILLRLHEAGLPVWFFGGLPENAIFAGVEMSPDSLIPTMRERGMTDVMVDGDFPCLRIYHAVRNGQDIYMFFNENMSCAAETVVHLPSRGVFARVDLLGDGYTADETADGRVSLSLAPNESLILLFGECEGLAPAYTLPAGEEISPAFRLSLAKYTALDEYEEIGKFSEFFNVTGRGAYPHFSGKMKYEFTFNVKKDGERVFLDLGRVGQNATLSLNGKPLGIRISAPYLFEITDALADGENLAEVVVANTLAQGVTDYYSQFLPLAPSGLLGGMRLIRL